MAAVQYCTGSLAEALCGSQVIKRFIMHAKKTAFIVEHDFIMAAYLADRVIVYDGIPSKDAVARTPQTLMSGVHLLIPSRKPQAYCERLLRVAMYTLHL